MVRVPTSRSEAQGIEYPAAMEENMMRQFRQIESLIKCYYYLKGWRHIFIIRRYYLTDRNLIIISVMSLSGYSLLFELGSKKTRWIDM